MKVRIKSAIYGSKKHSIRTTRRKKNPKNNKGNVRSLWDNFKHTNIHIMGVLDREERENKIENLFEKIMTENFPYLVKKVDIQVQEAQRVPNKMKPKRNTPRYIIIKMAKVKDRERILKAAREKH